MRASMGPVRHFDFLDDADRERLFLRAPEAFGSRGRAAAARAWPSAPRCTARRPGRSSPTTSSGRRPRGVRAWCCAWRTRSPTTPWPPVRATCRAAAAASPRTGRQPARCCSSGSAPPSRSRVVDAASARRRRAVRIRTAEVHRGAAASAFLEALAAAERRGGGTGCSRCRCWSPRSCCTWRPASRRSPASPAPSTSTGDRVLALRLGVTDFCSALYGLRRAPDMTVYDVQIVAAVIADVVNVLGRADGTGFTVTGPVWEYFRGPASGCSSRSCAQPLHRSTPRTLRGELIAHDLDGLLREIAARPGQRAARQDLHPPLARRRRARAVRRVSHEEYSDARDILGATGRRRRAALRATRTR